MDPSKRFVTLVLAAGVVVLVAAILIGERMGTRVLVRAENAGGLTSTPVITPLPASTDAPDGYGPDWKRSQTLAAAIDPRFPDPRVPPQPLPTLEPTPTPRPKPKWTPNPKLPIWDQTALPSPTPSPSDSPSPSPVATSSATPEP